MAEGLSRGDVVTVVLPGYYGKPRPALVVQTDLLNPTHASFIVCPFTTDRIAAPAFRPDFEPSAASGLERLSQLMIDKITALPREKVGRRIGRVSESDMQRVDRQLASVLGLTLR